MLGLARLVCQQRADCTYPGDAGGKIKKRLRPRCPIDSASTPDTIWIPTVAALGWLIITRDRAISSRPAEIAAVRNHGAKMLTLAGADAGSTWNQLELLMTRWREIDRLADRPGPFIVVATRTGALRAIPLD